MSRWCSELSFSPDFIIDNMEVVKQWQRYNGKAKRKEISISDYKGKMIWWICSEYDAKLHKHIIGGML